MCAKVLVFLLQIITIYSVPILNLNFTHYDAKGEFFIFKICSTVLEETDWRYMSMITFDLKTMELSEDFMKKFHKEVGPINYSESENFAPSSRAALLIFGNVTKLYHILSKRVPIWTPEVSYVILIRDTPISYENIFDCLWSNFFIAHVWIISLQNPNKMVSYNPFYKKLVENEIKVNDLNKMRTYIAKVTRQKMSKLNGYPIRVTLFPTRLKAVPQSDGTYAGHDGTLLQTLAKQMNFTPVIHVPKDGCKYGWKVNGSFTASADDCSYSSVLGALAEVVYGRTDIAFNGVFIKKYPSDDIQFTTPVHFDQVCLVVPKASPKPKWETIFLAFDSTLWVSLFITYWMVLLSWYVMKKVKERYFDASLLALNLYSIFLMMPLTRFPADDIERIMISTVILFSFIVASSFQSSMVKFLAYETYEQDIHTIEEVAKSNLQIMSASINLKELFETDENPLMPRLLERFSWMGLEKNRDILGDIAAKRKTAAIGRKSDIEEKIATSYVKGDRILLHIVEECPRSYHIAYLVPKKSPYLHSFNDIINYFVEAGITKSWFIHVKPHIPLSYYHTSVYQTNVFTVENLIIAFLILLFGLVLSSLSFLCELITQICINKNEETLNLKISKMWINVSAHSPRIPKI